MPSPTNLLAELAEVTEHWSPRVVAALNGQFLKLAKVKGAFVWHRHEAEDELFLVLRGRLRIELEGGEAVELAEGECYVVERGVLHRPIAEEECWMALFEPAATTHTGGVADERARSVADQIADFEARQPNRRAESGPA